MPEAYEFVPSSVNPMEWHLLVRFASRLLTSAVATPVKGTTYAAIDLPDKPCSGETRNGKAVTTWLLTKMERIEEGWVQFRFVPPKTRSEQNNSPFNSYPSQKPFTWPAYISKPVFDIDIQHPRVSEDKTGSLYLPRGLIHIGDYQSPVSGFWPTLIETFVSPTPFNEDDLEKRKPVPDVVELDWYGTPFGPMECLHPAFTQPLQNLAGKRSGGASAALKLIEPVKYEATNMQRWSPFALRDEVTYVESEGVYVRERETITPPTKRPRKTL